MTNDNGTKLFCMGLGIGVAAAFLFAPKSGQASRQYIRDKADEGADYLKRQAQQAADSTADALDRAAKAVRHQKENVTAAVNAGRNAYREAAATTPESDYRL
jgi:gas vesicle protein